MTASSTAKGLQIHAFVYIAVIAVNTVINVMTGPPWWVLWVIFPWGIGLIAHWFFTRNL
ncbi:MAG: 2TM domain-containing protein [Candidatus Devosia phytovorans]|uniref:2TM domain-containing protein n=1 Tax=Candidatus Devosia phytovorans TaxID=3121372 RepID=A0AAJ5VZG6_9HYPH|nr:2TM domain-containing protein [Devosia sp.]WEK06319.1 MAG: 2TM domain-containing protein [Devosia sp.]